MLLEEEQLWREMVKEILFPICAHYVITATGSMTETIPKGGPGGGKRKKNRKRKEKGQWGRKLEGEKERALIMRIEKDRKK